MSEKFKTSTEIFSAAVVAMVEKIPVAHLHGGELTEGAIDDSLRHAITKISHIIDLIHAFFFIVLRVKTGSRIDTRSDWKNTKKTDFYDFTPTELDSTPALTC